MNSSMLSNIPGLEILSYNVTVTDANLLPDRLTGKLLYISPVTLVTLVTYKIKIKVGN